MPMPGRTGFAGEGQAIDKAHATGPDRSRLGGNRGPADGLMLGRDHRNRATGNQRPTLIHRKGDDREADGAGNPK